MSSGSVTIAIPVHNGAAHLAEAIESARTQTVPVDIRVFDNASTDTTAEIGRRILGDGAVVVNAANLGAAENFNNAVRQTDGEFVAWLAHDDRLRPRFVEACLQALEANPDAPACLTGIQFTDSTGAPTRVHSDPDLASAPRTRLRSFLRRRRWTETYSLYRREWLERSPLFGSEGGADVLLTWWFLLRAPLAVVSEPLLEYREYPLESVDQATAKARAASAPGTARVQHWHKVRLWRRLWAMTRDTDLDPKVARTARRELLLLVAWPGIVFWVADDVLDRWPGIDRSLRRAWDRVGSPGRIAPTR